MTEFGVLVFFTNLGVMELQVRYLVLFLLFWVIGIFESFYRRSLHKNIQLMLEFSKGPFLVLQFSYFTLMTFLMMLSLTLLSMLMMLLCILNVMGHLICGNNWNWLLKLNLIYERLWTGAGSGLLISMLEKLNWFRLIDLITLVLLMWKWMGLFLSKNNLLRCWDWLSLLNWIGALTLYLLLKLPPRKLGLWFVLWSFFLLCLLYIFINLPFGFAWNTVAMSGLVLVVAIWICWKSYKNEYARLLVVHLLLLLNPWVILRM